MAAPAPFCFQIQPLQLQQYRESADALESRFTNFWAGNIHYPTRMISRLRRFSYRGVRQGLRQRLAPLDDLRELIPLLEKAGAGEPHVEQALSRQLRERSSAIERATGTLRDATEVQAALAQLLQNVLDEEALIILLDGCKRAVWPWRWYKNQHRLYDTLEHTAPPLAVDHYLLCWPEEAISAQGLQDTLKASFLLPGVEQTALPNLIHGRYREERDYLAPMEPGDPFLTVLSAYDVRGEWDLYSLAPLLMGENELAIAIDIETFQRATAQRKTTDAHTVLREAVYGKHAVKDARAERALQAADYTLLQLDQQNLHMVAYTILLQAPTLTSLERQAQSIRDVLGAKLRLDRLAGAQAEYLRFFTPQPAKAIQAPYVRRNTLSQGVAVKVPWGIRKTARTSGTVWGYDIHEGMLIHYDPWGEATKGGFENAHLMMVGRAGSGKTVFLNTIGARRAVAGDQVVFFDPIGKSQWLCESVGGGAAYYDVATDSAINILDPLSPDMSRQLDQVARKLSIILGRTVSSGGRINFTPRVLSNGELGALDRALQDPAIYGPDGERLAQLRPATAPRLEHLAEALRSVAKRERKPEGALLADEIADIALGSRARIFNEPTSLHWDFASDVIGYNFKEADPGLLALYYDHGFEALNAWVRSEERRRRNQPLLFMLDEYFYMASVPALESYIALATKTWRNYRAAAVTGDQNATTYFGQDGLPSQWGPFTANNCLIKVFFRQENSEAEIIGRAYKDLLSPDDIEFIKTAGTGEYIILLGDEVHRMTNQLTDLEASYFLR